MSWAWRGTSAALLLLAACSKDPEQESAMPPSAQAEVAETTAPTAPEPNYLQANFNRALSVLPSGFEGNSWTAMLRTVEATTLNNSKEPYETHAEFAARLAKSLPPILYGEVSTTGLVGIVIPIKNSRLSYDVERQQLHIRSDPEIVDLPQKNALPLRTERSELGVKDTSHLSRVVPKYPSRMNHVVIRIGGLSLDKPALDKMRVDVSLPVPRQKAREMQWNQVSYLYIGKLAPPFASIFKSLEMSDDPPYLYTEYEYELLHLALEEVWLFDRTSGEVLKKFGGSTKPAQKRKSTR